MKQYDDKVERFHRCQTKFRFAEREAQCILGERGFSLFTVRSNLVPRVLSLLRESTLVAAGHVSMHANRSHTEGGSSA